MADGWAVLREPVLGLSPGALRVLRAMADHQIGFGYPITIRGLCEALGLTSTNAVSEQLRRLERRGAITQGVHFRARAHVITPDGWRAAGLEPPAVPTHRVFELGQVCALCERTYFTRGGTVEHVCREVPAPRPADLYVDRGRSA